MNKTKSIILNKTNIGKIKSILATAGVNREKAELTELSTALLGEELGNKEKTLTKIVSTKSNIKFYLYFISPQLAQIKNAPRSMVDDLNIQKWI